LKPLGFAQSSSPDWAKILPSAYSAPLRLTALNALRSAPCALLFPCPCPSAYCLLPTVLLHTANCRTFVCYLPAVFLLPTAYCLLPAAYCSPLSAGRFLAAHCLLSYFPQLRRHEAPPIRVEALFSIRAQLTGSPVLAAYRRQSPNQPPPSHCQQIVAALLP